MVIAETTTVPLSSVQNLIDPHPVLVASTINGCEGATMGQICPKLSLEESGDIVDSLRLASLS